MMQNGASGYVLKNASIDEIINAIETAVNGEIFLSDQASIAMAENKNTLIPLITRREKEVLLLISKGLTNKEIADKLFISTTTVDTHRKNLLAKFQVKNTASLISLATQNELLHNLDLKINNT
jgi:DNA-binding NarL/FixJ family response regulator